MKYEIKTIHILGSRHHANIDQSSRSIIKVTIN